MMAHLYRECHLLRPFADDEIRRKTLGEALAEERTICKKCEERSTRGC